MAKYTRRLYVKVTYEKEKKIYVKYH